MGKSVITYSRDVLITRDSPTWRVVYETYTPVIYSVLRAKCLSSIRAQGLDETEILAELAQDTWASLWIGLLNGTVERIEEATVVLAAKWVAWNAAKRQFTDVEHVPLEAAYDVEHPNRPDRDAQIKQGLDRVFASLSHEDRYLFDSRVYDGVPYQELAAQMEEEVYVLKMRMVRITRKIRQELGVDIAV